MYSSRETGTEALDFFNIWKIQKKAIAIQFIRGTIRGCFEQNLSSDLQTKGIGSWILDHREMDINGFRSYLRSYYIIYLVISR